MKCKSGFASVCLQRNLQLSPGSRVPLTGGGGTFSCASESSMATEGILHKEGKEWGMLSSLQTPHQVEVFLLKP